MNNQDRAKQFMPFDALKGLQEALRLKEYEHERITTGEISEEKASELTASLMSIQQGDCVEITYFFDGHYLTKIGRVKINFNELYLIVDEKKFMFDNINKITLVRKKEEI